MAEEQELDRLEPGQRAVVLRVNGRGHTRKRLIDLGMTPGSVVEMVRRAPLGDPMVFRIKGYLLSIRKAEARLVTVTPEDTAATLPLTLADAPLGKTFHVATINAGNGLCRRLAGMGISENAVVKVTRRQGRGKLDVLVGGARVLLGRGMASKVLLRNPAGQDKSEEKAEQ